MVDYNKKLNLIKKTNCQKRCLNDIYMRFYNCVHYLMKLQRSKFETILSWYDSLLHM